MIIYNLILPHGMIGQYLRGEVPLSENRVLYKLIEDKKINKKELSEIIYVLNYCIIASVNKQIWKEIKEQVQDMITLILDGNFEN
ncbi:MAG: hypothetical protein ACERKV_09490 [Clostridiaceae bacterium]